MKKRIEDLLRRVDEMAVDNKLIQDAYNKAGNNAGENYMLGRVEVLRGIHNELASILKESE